MELRAGRTLSLTDTLTLAQLGVRAAIQDRRKSAHADGIIGQVFGRAVTRNCDEGWIVRRWFIFGVEGELPDDVRGRIDARTGNKWMQRVDSGLDQLGRYVDVIPVISSMVTATARLITGDGSGMSMEDAALLESLRTTFDVGPDEFEPEELSRDFYERSSRLSRPLSSDDEGLIGSAFIEYANSLGTGMWNAYPSGAPSKAALVWNRYLSDAKSIATNWYQVPRRSALPKYVDYRRNKKK
jgi:hypothetical protein